jgi:hypothetical protein
MTFPKRIFRNIAIISLMISCTSSNENDNPLPLGDFDQGVFILNQGNFAQSNSSLSFWSHDFTYFQNNVFSIVNPNINLGDTGQDIGFYEDKAFIVLNYSNTIQVVNRYSLEHITTIDNNLSNPRYIAFADGKIYVTNWGDGGNPNDDYVLVLNAHDYSFNTNIPVLEGPERLIAHNNMIYVAHQGGYGFNNIVSAINPFSNTVENTITVGDVPNALAIHQGNLWVMCGGKPSWSGNETPGEIIVLDLPSYETVKTYTFDEGQHPNHLIISNDDMYYTVDAAVYKTTASSTNLPTTAFITMEAQGVYGIYSLGIYGNKIYVGDAADYNSNGSVFVFSTNGSLLDQKTVGIIPAGFYFNN